MPLTGNNFDFSGINIGTGSDLVFISGPCVIESEAEVMAVAAELKRVADLFKIQLIFKSSYDKANRTSVTSFRGPGLREGLRILKTIKDELGLRVTSDVHRIGELALAAEVLDIIQIPAFLCRQTDLLVEAARTMLPVNIKKGQFLSPWDMRHVIEKVKSQGNNRVMVTERGVSFGYNNLVVDIRGFEVMRAFGVPVIFDATHSVQLPGGQDGCSGGQREFIYPLARAAVAAGVDGLFMEVHPRPDQALCDGPNSFPLDQLPYFLETIHQIHQLVNKVSSLVGADSI
ncbi:MAG: 3-deoxy-8-phosphooctulonate synthase [Deltaproteobacteria bacterium]|nr:3-deoxy-8-phosphooctulonate synthase [Deltaproteobacteria bacterium]